MRLDLYLSEKGLVPSRQRGKQLITSGCVRLEGKVCMKPSAQVEEGCAVQVDIDDPLAVGRGLTKLEGAFDAFALSVEGRVCADIGASTGGFTQCMLRRGARLVYAVDVGHSQLHESLLKDERVVNMEGVNARELTSDSFEIPPEFMSVDLSFISLKLVMPALKEALAQGGELAVLIKPQFEAGRSALNKKGIVRDKKDHLRVLGELYEFFTQLGLSVRGLVPSVIKGGDGNIEYLAHLVKDNSGNVSVDIKAVVNRAFSGALQ